jgi:ankyrin repeat protein
MDFDALHRVIKKGDVIALRRELDAGLDPNLRNRLAWTLLMLCAMEGDTQLAELLISRGANLDSENDFGETALSLAAHGGHTSFVKMLISMGASVDSRPHGCSLEQWLKGSSGLPEQKIAEILAIIKAQSR